MSNPEREGQEATPEEAALPVPEARPDADPDIYGRGPWQQRPKPVGEWLRIATAGAAAIVLGLGALGAIDALARILTVLFLGITIAAALGPLVERLERGRIPRALAVVAIYAILLGLVIILGFIIVPGLLVQGQALVDSAPAALDAAEAWLNRQSWLLGLLGVEQITDLELLDAFAAGLTGVGTALLSVPGTVVTLVAESLLVIFISIYWLILTHQISRFVASLFPSDDSSNILSVLQQVGRAMGGYLRGMLIDASILAVVTYLGLLLIGVNYALVLGVLAGMGEIVPIVGPVVAGSAIVLVAIFQSPQTALFALIFVLILQQFESNVLVPLVMKSQVDISPLLTLIAVAVGGTIGGLLGAVAALPVAAALNALVRVAVAPAIRRHTGAPPPEE